MTMDICIPKVNKEQLNKTFIFNVFKKLELGIIKNVTIRETDCVFINFSKWFETERNSEILKKLQCGENIYVVYDQKWGWFWKCCIALPLAPSVKRSTFG
jgi:hypothetical protein